MSAFQDFLPTRPWPRRPKTTAFFFIVDDIDKFRHAGSRNFNDDFSLFWSYYSHCGDPNKDFQFIQTQWFFCLGLEHESLASLLSASGR